MSRNNTPSVLSSLNAYGDSDPEEGSEGENEGEDVGKVQLLLLPPPLNKLRNTLLIARGSPPNSPSPKPPQLTTAPQYTEDDEDNFEFQGVQEEQSDDEVQDNDKEEDQVDANIKVLSQDDHYKDDPSQKEPEENEEGTEGSWPAKRSKYSHLLPPPPKDHCSPELEAKFAKMMALKNKGRNVNDMIQGMKGFRNPSIYNKFILLCNIEENGTNFTHAPTFAPSSYYEELDKAQRLEMERRFKEKEKRAKDQSVKLDLLKGSLPGLLSTVPPIVVVPPTAIISGSGQKPPSTYIRAFGNLAFKN